LETFIFGVFAFSPWLKALRCAKVIADATQLPERGVFGGLPRYPLVFTLVI